MSLIGNVPLLQKALDHIEAHPDEWDQALWGAETVCGTVACLAGHIVQMTGWEPVDFSFTSEGREWSWVDKDGVRLYVADAALSELGVAPGEHEEDVKLLFMGSNTRAQLWEYAQQLTNGQLTLPPDLA